MILLDCGNSNLKAQLRQDGQLLASYNGSYKPDWVRRLSHWMKDLPATHCYLTSVLDVTRQELLEQCLVKQFDKAVTRFVSVAEVLGVKNAYRDPGRLGADRWMALIAASEMVSGNAIVIDAGSAITLDLLRGDGQHLGGAILPGIHTSLEDFKRIFSHVDFDDSAIARTDEPGCSTEEAIHINYAHSPIEFLPRLVNRWISHLDNDATLLLTGGDAARVQFALEQQSRIVPDLVFRGMNRLASQ
ncbi:MAG: type III pantothenate kinase [Gammaproteobacteria bacterium]|nr:type III pantothenate kinase [Gammaproteobacteria bacterium]